MLKLAAFSILVLGLIAATRSLTFSASNSDVQYRTASVEVRDLSRTISATGTLEPCEIIDVGAQVAGRVIEFGTDPLTNKPIDFGTQVKKGMVLARIDPSVYEIEVEIAEAQSRRMAAQVAQAKSQLKESEAALLRSQAELRQHQSKLSRAKSDWERAAHLHKSNAISTAEADTARSDLESVEAAVAVAKATIEQAKSHLESQRAAIQSTEAECDNATAVLKRAKTTLSYCSILSPIDGTIIDRRINQGQTVVASLSTPSLFLLASDLRELEIWVSVNEADIGQIKPGLPVRFTVDSNPDERYCGEVKQVRLNASMSQNVVTYTVVVSVENSNETLLPYLTANVEFVVEEHSSVLAVPTAALRYVPKNAQKSSSRSESRKTVWVKEASTVREVEVTVGISEDNLTEVRSDQLSRNMEVVIGELSDDSAQSISNPFVPKMPGTEKKTND